jgi:ankyrin repeat protein
VIITARVGTWFQLVDEITRWLKTSPEARRGGCKGTLAKSFSNTLLTVVVLESCVEVKDKIHGLVLQYDAEVESCGFLVSYRSLFMNAVFNKDTDSAVALLERGADPNKVCSIWGENAYVFAAENNLIEIFETMTLYKADIYQTNAIGENALFAAVRNGHVGIAKILLGKGMSPDGYTITDRFHLLHVAVANRSETSTNMIKFLLENGANPHLRSYSPAGYVYSSPGNGYTPLQFMLASESGVSSFKSFSKREMIFVNKNAKLLIEKMNQDVKDREIALCMVSQERLSSNPGCLLSSLSGEPSILQMIMEKASENFDDKYPSNVLSGTVAYTGVIDYF